MSERLRVYIGWDERQVEAEAYNVAASSAREFGCQVIQLREDVLRSWGVLTRPLDRRGSMWDLNSSAPQSTSFAITRFAVPLLAHDGWALFADGDVVFLSDPHPILDLRDPSKAVMVVKHAAMQLAGTKMDGQQQTSYHRKLWSSVCFYNCGHPANRRLNLTMLNQWPGRELHAFNWLADDEIGELDARWNWLVGIVPKPVDPVIAHFTNGTPNMPGHEDDEHAEIWLQRASER